MTGGYDPNFIGGWIFRGSTTLTVTNFTITVMDIITAMDIMAMDITAKAIATSEITIGRGGIVSEYQISPPMASRLI